MIFFTAEFCSVSPTGVIHLFWEKKFPGPSCDSPPGFHFYQVEIQLSFKLSPILNRKAGDFFFFYCFVTRGHATLLAFGGCSQQSGDR